MDDRHPTRFLPVSRPATGKSAPFAWPRPLVLGVKEGQAQEPIVGPALGGRAP